MNSQRKSAIALSIVCLLGWTKPVFAQFSSGAESLDEASPARSKIVDIDIVTNSPTLQNQPSIQPPQATSNSSCDFSAVQGVTPQQTGLAQQNVFTPTTQNASIAPASIGEQSTAKQPIQIDPQTVGRVVGVAGTALMLGAFLKNGGIGGMMNTFGLDNRFHTRGTSLAPY